MLYQVAVADQQAGGRSGPVATLKGPSGTRAEVWAAHGFNCLRWSVAPGHEALFAMDDWEDNAVPTRSGIPILAPFPNRIRGGKFDWRGAPHQLPLNDSTKANAIHGEAPRHAWQIDDFGESEASAWVDGSFRPAVDAPEVAGNWTGDYQLAARWELAGTDLRFSYEFRNLSAAPMPFGFGLHPYLRFPTAPADELIDACSLEVPAETLWELNASLPTAKKLPVAAETDFRAGRPIAETNIDLLYTGLTGPAGADGLRLHGRIRHPGQPGSLEVWADGSFREIVLFTPVHRKAVCIEPYTCATDAVNLNARGTDAGLIELPADGRVAGKVEFRWHPAG